jgi:hypothetical protein
MTAMATHQMRRQIPDVGVPAVPVVLLRQPLTTVIVFNGPMTRHIGGEGPAEYGCFFPDREQCRAPTIKEN